MDESAGQHPDAVPAGLPRLLPPRPEDLRGHLARFGPVPYRGRRGALIGDVKRSGLTGRGGAAFPAHRKLAIVAAARGPGSSWRTGLKASPPAVKTRR